LDAEALYQEGKATKIKFIKKINQKRLLSLNLCKKNLQFKKCPAKEIKIFTEIIDKYNCNKNTKY
jgi:hypothetical protein